MHVIAFIFRRAVLPIQLDLEEKEDMEDTEGVDEYAEHMHQLKKSIYEKAITNIENAQQY